MASTRESHKPHSRLRNTREGRSANRDAALGIALATSAEPGISPSLILSQNSQLLYRPHMLVSVCSRPLLSHKFLLISPPLTTPCLTHLFETGVDGVVENSSSGLLLHPSTLITAPRDPLWPQRAARRPNTLTHGPAKPWHAAWRARGPENRKFHRVRGGGLLCTRAE